jgi:hypothetical protein
MGRRVSWCHSPLWALAELAELLVLLRVARARLPTQPPRFSWDTVPVFMHSGNRSGLSADEASFMSRFPLVTMGGFQGGGNPGGNEAAITPFAKAVKMDNHSARVLYYQNALINFPQTRLGGSNSTLPTSLLVHDARGRLVYLGGCGGGLHAPNHTIYDHSQPAMRGAWTANIVDVVRDPANSGLVDGVFCDRSGPITAVLTKYLSCYEFEEGWARRWDEGHWQAVADTQAALDKLLPTAIVVANHASPQTSMNLAGNSTWNAKMYEHFTPLKAAGMDYVPTGNQLRAFRSDGGQFIDEVHVDFCRVDMAGGNGSSTPARDMYRRSLAAFLIGATDYSYVSALAGCGTYISYHLVSPYRCRRCLWLIDLAWLRSTRVPLAGGSTKGGRTGLPTTTVRWERRSGAHTSLCNNTHAPYVLKFPQCQRWPHSDLPFPGALPCSEKKQTNKPPATRAGPPTAPRLAGAVGLPAEPRCGSTSTTRTPPANSGAAAASAGRTATSRAQASCVASTAARERVSGRRQVYVACTQS